MIDVKGTRSDQSGTDPTDPLELRKEETGTGRIFSGWFASLVALGLYIRSFLWAEPETVHALPEDKMPDSESEDETGAPVLHNVSFEATEEDPEADPGSSQGSGAAEEPQGSTLLFPVFLGSFDDLPFLPPSQFTMDAYLPRSSANTTLPPFSGLRAVGADSPALAASGPAGSSAAPAPPPETETDPAEEDETDTPRAPDRNRAPQNKGPVYLADVGSGAAVGFALSFFLSQTIDADGDGMSVTMISSSSGAMTPKGDGWRYLADTDYLGEVRIEYVISEGAEGVTQTAYLNVIENIHDGTEGDDLIVGTIGRDRIDGQAGDDNLAGLGGRDRIYGEDGDDNIAGGDGNDSLFGGDGDDLIVGGTGDDWISGGAGQDRLYGGLGDDEIYGDEGNDAAYGGDGRDTIFGGDGDDLIRGNAGADLLSGDAGMDRLFGGDGDDVMSGGAGADTAFGDAGDDLLFGDDGDDHLDGGDGADILTGDAGNDMLLGGNADDILTGGAGEDVVSGGAGDDVVIADDDAMADHFNGGDGHDRLDYSAATKAVIFDLAEGMASGESTGADCFEEFEHIIGSAGDDIFRAGAGEGNLTGNGGADLYSFVQGDTVEMIRSSYLITDYDADDEIWIGTGSSRYHIRKAQKSIEERIEDELEDYAEGIGADEPHLSFHFDWTETYRRTAIEVDFDRDKVVDLEVMLDGEHVFVVEHT
ncbi:cadherin-like domain-containing protein [Roseovarius sp. S1116L3]|uniref:cadherin-like domain-containing protein n=1 Tax=Roseovarius roseus TaxID=3342636 RepID=UPI00372B4C4F